ncbi:RTA1 like protein [Staphylotrichum tortipilum]|uniref:RTA1 like protein n=1 Tax=Staphylotrichum tortipilum TaxID=2831512 RepID=A0AAN6RVE1_9PEZI|nr:RTA1 like protein [Staphylotrichum longicolle]
MSTNITRPSFDWCTEVSLDCPVKATTLGYYPNKGVNIFVALGFGLAALVTIAMGVWKRTWGFSAAVAAGCILECVGYIGRVLLSSNPWNGAAFKMQIVAIILGPTLVCIGLYLTLKHAVVALARDLSRLPPRVYPLFFVPADVSCLVIQAIGGGIAAAATRENYALLQHGNRTIMAGIVLQVVVLGFFGALAGDYFLRVSKRFKSIAEPEGADAAGAALWADRRFRTFVWAMVAAYGALLVRCIYRIAEMAGGWGNHIMQDEPSFVVLESFMVLIACGILAAFAPGLLFPQMSHGYGGGEGEGEKRAQGTATESDSAGLEMERV